MLKKGRQNLASSSSPLKMGITTGFKVLEKETQKVLSKQFLLTYLKCTPHDVERTFQFHCRTFFVQMFLQLQTQILMI